MMSSCKPRHMNWIFKKNKFWKGKGESTSLCALWMRLVYSNSCLFDWLDDGTWSYYNVKTDNDQHQMPCLYQYMLIKMLTVLPPPHFSRKCKSAKHWNCILKFQKQTLKIKIYKLLGISYYGVECILTNTSTNTHDDMWLSILSLTLQ